MLRIIKFRVWDKYNKEMLEVENLYFNEMNGQVEIRTRTYSDYFNEDEMILMQYTGLKDKNGKEIYEGDIVKDNWLGYKRAIKFSTKDVGSCGCCYARFEGSGFIAEDIDLNNCEVIGNIYDNLDLLKEE